MSTPTPDTISYQITRIVLGEPRNIPIIAQEFDEIISENNRLLTVLAIEGKLDLVLANFAEYEEELLRLALHQQVFTDWRPAVFREAIKVVNRRIVNLLSSTRLYLDQVTHDVSAMYGNSSTQLSVLRSCQNAAYDSHFEYRLMEALRNHVQHRSMPVHELSFPMQIEREEPVQFRFSVIPALVIERLHDDEDFKASVLKELNEKGKKVALTPAIRSYVASICRIHEQIRQITDPEVRAADTLMESVRNRAREVFGAELVGLGVIARDRRGRSTKYAYLLEDTIGERKNLRRKNHTFTNFERRYTSASLPDQQAG